MHKVVGTIGNNTGHAHEISGAARLECTPKVRQLN